MSTAIPEKIIDAFKVLDGDLSSSLIEALTPVAPELGDREQAVLERLANGIASSASAAELNAFVRLLPVTVSRAVQPVLEPVLG
ncbi:MAG: hypothetical protein U0Y82_13550 [Thermoleophilia bacterium]